MASYTQLKVWNKAVDLVTDVYEATRAFPKDECFGLRLQMRRAAVSIPSNIAEGHGRFTKKDYRHFVLQARGSVLELETQVLISQRLQFLTVDASNQLRAKTQEIGRMLNGLLRYLTAGS